jgi:hypothetical protein
MVVGKPHGRWASADVEALRTDKATAPHRSAGLADPASTLLACARAANATSLKCNRAQAPDLAIVAVVALQRLTRATSAGIDHGAAQVSPYG